MKMTKAAGTGEVSYGHKHPELQSFLEDVAGITPEKHSVSLTCAGAKSRPSSQIFSRNQRIMGNGVFPVLQTDA